MVFETAVVFSQVIDGLIEIFANARGVYDLCVRWVRPRGTTDAQEGQQASKFPGVGGLCLRRGAGAGVPKVFDDEFEFVRVNVVDVAEDVDVVGCTWREAYGTHVAHQRISVVLVEAETFVGTLVDGSLPYSLRQFLKKKCGVHIHAPHRVWWTTITFLMSKKYLAMPIERSASSAWPPALMIGNIVVVASTSPSRR